MGDILKANACPAVVLPSIPCHRCEVRNRAFCNGVEPEELHRLDAIATEIHLKAKQMVILEGDPADFVFNVTRGMVRASKSLLDGRRQITGFLYPGDFVGAAVYNRYMYDAEAINRATLCRFPKSKLRALFVAFPQLESRLHFITENELATAQDQILLLGRKSARERVASFLLVLAQRAVRRGESGWLLDMPMSRSDIADYLGLSTETVCRILASFREDGLIDYNTRTAVILQPREQLELVAEGS